jgi:hypothetical protein
MVDGGIPHLRIDDEDELPAVVERRGAGGPKGAKLGDCIAAAGPTRN